MADVAVNEQYEGPCGAAAGLWRHEPAQGINPCRPDTTREHKQSCGSTWTFWVVPWLRTCLPRQDTRVPSLVGELRCHVLWGNEAPPPRKRTPPPAPTAKKKTGEVRPTDASMSRAWLWCSLRADLRPLTPQFNVEAQTSNPVQRECSWRRGLERGD